MYIPAYAAYIYILPYTPYEGGSPTLNQENGPINIYYHVRYFHNFLIIFFDFNQELTIL